MSDSRKETTKNKWRNYYLRSLAISTYLLTAYALVNPTAGNNSIANFEFPQQIKLNVGKLVASPNSMENYSSKQDGLKTTISAQEIVETEQNYQYIQDGSDIALKISYLVNTRGNVESYLKQYTNIAPETIANKEISQIKTTGYYALLNDRDRIYLSTCVSPRSPGNVTQKQFSRYRYQNDLTLQTAWEWLQKKSSIRDRRCLWIHMSTPLADDFQTASKTLETAWQEIYPWLTQNFPAL